MSENWYIRDMIQKFWSLRDISVASNATWLEIVPNNNIFFVYTPLWRVLYNLKERPGISNLELPAFEHCKLWCLQT